MVECPAAAGGKPRAARLSAVQRLEASLIEHTFGFSGVIAPENPNTCDHAPRMPGIEYGIQDIGDETAWLGRPAGMPATKQTAPESAAVTAVTMIFAAAA